MARGWVGASVKKVAFEKRYAEAWQAQDALTVIAQRGTRFDRVTIDYEPPAPPAFIVIDEASSVPDAAWDAEYKALKR